MSTAQSPCGWISVYFNAQTKGETLVHRDSYILITNLLIVEFVWGLVWLRKIAFAAVTRRD